MDYAVFHSYAISISPLLPLDGCDGGLHLFGTGRSKMAKTVSICLAMYNGQSFIYEQLSSILPQLGDSDEIIICDDCSHDRSVKIVKEFNDSRIRIFEADVNCGHVVTFERALRQAKNDIILFSDQDDIWTEDHVAVLRDALEEIDGPALVYGNFSEFGDFEWVQARTHKTAILPRLRGKYHFLLLLLKGQTRMFGSAMAINRQAVSLCVPIPSSVSSHDLWIAYLVCAGGVVSNINQVITHRRLHAANVSDSRRGLATVVRDRLNYLFHAWKRIR